ncbi:hypothetical protein L1887_25444 [Cichorium endivia]|nr:hypothetical protein L1887_25444 [Cichorium endivia]
MLWGGFGKCGVVLESEQSENILQDLTESLQRLKEYKLDIKSRIFEREETEKEDLHSVEIVEEVLGSDLDKGINVTEDVLEKKHYSIHENENDFGKSFSAFLKGVEEDTKRQPQIRDFRAVDLV